MLFRKTWHEVKGLLAVTVLCAVLGGGCSLTFYGLREGPTSPQERPIAAVQVGKVQVVAPARDRVSRPAQAAPVAPTRQAAEVTSSEGERSEEPVPVLPTVETTGDGRAVEGAGDGEGDRAGDALGVSVGSAGGLAIPRP